MTIRDWPEDERPREKLQARGAAALSDAELLALFLGSGQRGRTAVDLGRDLLNTHAGLKALLEVDAGALAQLPGIGPAKACRLHAALELGRRYLATRPDEGLSRQAGEQRSRHAIEEASQPRRQGWQERQRESAAAVRDGRDDEDELGTHRRGSGRATMRAAAMGRKAWMVGSGTANARQATPRPAATARQTA